MRQVITAKDIQLYFGKKESMSFKMMTQMKKELGKKKHQPITITEFCEYYNVEKEGIVDIIEKTEEDKQQRITKNQVIEIEKDANQITSISSYKQSIPYVISKRTW
jgi:hypothetical protein